MNNARFYHPIILQPAVSCERLWKGKVLWMNHIAAFSGGSRIFPRGGRQLPKVLLFFNFCQKLHENERIWTPRGGARPWRPPWIRQWHLYHVTFFRNVISDAFRIKFGKVQTHFGHFSKLYPKCIRNASEMYQKSIPNWNKNTIFLQNKPTIHPETNQLSSIHCKK